LQIANAAAAAAAQVLEAFLPEAAQTAELLLSVSRAGTPRLHNPIARLVSSAAAASAAA
jgi:hypothetical protein